MKIKKYIAKSMKEPLLQVKAELGEEAVILKTRRLPKKLFSLGEQDQMEVTAALDEQAVRQQAFAPINLSALGVYTRPHTPSSAASPAATAAGTVKETAHPPRSTTFDWQILELKEDIRELKDLVRNILTSGGSEAAGGFAGGWAVLYKRLVDSGVEPQVASLVIKNIQGDAPVADSEINKTFVSSIARHFPVSGPIVTGTKKPVTVAFVGPTGAGKTTTIAKLAAHFSLNKKRNVTLVTNDTYRIAAIEQVRAFAEIMGIGLQVLFAPEETAEVLRGCEGDDVVLVDTAGRSQQNAKHMEELERILGALGPDETHLVLSATTKDADLREAVERFRGLGVNRLVFTKLDETSVLGNVFNTVNLSGIPVSYFTFGQSVPEDIELAQPGRFIQRLWERSVV
jgi:flagellar biosynthesis protein FlhF